MNSIGKLIFLFSFFIKGVPTPALYLIDLDRRSIYMEHMENTIVLKNYIDENVSDKVNVEHIVKFIGKGLGLVIAKLHSKNIVHGDLTTSNVLLKNISDGTWTEDEGKVLKIVI